MSLTLLIVRCIMGKVACTNCMSMYLQNKQLTFGLAYNQSRISQALFNIQTLHDLAQNQFSRIFVKNSTQVGLSTNNSLSLSLSQQWCGCLYFFWAKPIKLQKKMSLTLLIVRCIMVKWLIPIVCPCTCRTSNLHLGQHISSLGLVKLSLIYKPCIDWVHCDISS